MTLRTLLLHLRLNTYFIYFVLISCSHCLFFGKGWMPWAVLPNTSPAGEDTGKFHGLSITIPHAFKALRGGGKYVVFIQLPEFTYHQHRHRDGLSECACQPVYTIRCGTRGFRRPIGLVRKWPKGSSWTSNGIFQIWWFKKKKDRIELRMFE